MHSPKALCQWVGMIMGCSHGSRSQERCPGSARHTVVSVAKRLSPQIRGRNSCQLNQGWLPGWGPDASLDMELFPGQWDRPYQISNATEKPIWEQNKPLSQWIHPPALCKGVTQTTAAQNQAAGERDCREKSGSGQSVGQGDLAVPCVPEERVLLLHRLCHTPGQGLVNGQGG